MLAAHPVLCIENIENSLELWPVANRLDKTGLVQSQVYPLPTLQERSTTRWTGLFLISHAHCLAFLQARVKHRAVSHLPEIFMQQGCNQRGSLSVLLSCYQGEGTWESDTPASTGMLAPQCFQRKLQSIDACDSKWDFSSGLQHQQLQGIV